MTPSSLHADSIPAPLPSRDATTEPPPARSSGAGEGRRETPRFGLVSLSDRKKLISILLATIIFALVGGLTTQPAIFGITNAVMIGLGVGLFEEFYVQSLRGRWLRGMHPLRSILIYTLVVTAIYLVAMHLSHLILGHIEGLTLVYSRLPFTLPLVIVFSVIGIVVMRVVHFIGPETLFHLMVGTYHRPVLEKKMLLFIDMNGSTALAERLGAFATRSLVGKFLFDISGPITNFGGDIYLYKGDGLIAVWDWKMAVKGNKLLHAIDALGDAMRREGPEYQRQFGLVPSFRIGVHGGDVVVSEQGDTKRAIGVYGDTINIAARMEEAAKAYGVGCVLSGQVAAALSAPADRLVALGNERIKGISAPMPICEYRSEGEGRGAGDRAGQDVAIPWMRFRA
ncbi:Adenylate cyclase, class 3 [Rhizobiales bacterium GAS188]|nr:Adenylate cyclase, class 3 [Rhizobiales bacterium GAS188]